MKKTIIAPALLAVLAGCASEPGAGTAAVQLPALTNPADAMVVVYRPEALDHFARTPSVALDGAPACDLGNGKWFSREVKPGAAAVTTSLWDWPGTSKAGFAAEAGKTYYVRMKPDYEKRLAGIFGGGPIGVAIANHYSDRAGPFLLDVIDGDQARKEMGGMAQAVCR